MMLWRTMPLLALQVFSCCSSFVTYFHSKRYYQRNVESTCIIDAYRKILTNYRFTFSHVAFSTFPFLDYLLFTLVYSEDKSAKYYWENKIFWGEKIYFYILRVKSIKILIIILKFPTPSISWVFQLNCFVNAHEHDHHSIIAVPSSAEKMVDNLLSVLSHH